MTKKIQKKSDAHKTYMRKLLNVRSETLIEAIIAISILIIVLAPASAMIISSSKTIGQNRNDLVASALAEEGLEIMRSFRDTNLIRFAQKADSCWNTKPDPALTLDNCADVANKIGGDDTIVAERILNLQMNPDSLAWSQDHDGNGVPILPAPPITDYQLSYDTATQADPECPANNGACHTHTGIYFYPDKTVGAPLPRGQLSPFFRQIQIQYIDIDQDGKTDPIMKVTSTVQYAVSGGMRTIKRILFLTNKPAL